MNTQKNVFIISKPIVPPWNDSGKNIAKDLVINGKEYTYRILTTKDFEFANQERIQYERIYPSGGTFQAGLKQNLKVMFTGLNKKDASIYHYFFAPNKLSATAGKVQRFVTGVKTVQTFCSRPASYKNINELIFTDKVIVLSADTREKLLNAGVAANKLVHIPPGISIPKKMNEEEKKRLRTKYNLPPKKVILFPGDYEFSGAAQYVADAAERIVNSDPNIVLVFACRAKTERSKAKKEQIKTALAPLGDRVRFLDEIDDMPRFVGLADILLLPQDNLYAKMDIPLVLLEAMAHGVPLLVADSGPLQELVNQGAALGATVHQDTVAETTIRLIQNKQLLTQLGNTGKSLVATRYNAISMAKAIETLYEELLAT